jgi:hypothetical protein
VTGLALGTALAGIVLWGLRLLYNWRERRAGRMEVELEQRRARDKAVKRAAEIDSEVRRLDDAGLARELRDKWSRD